MRTLNLEFKYSVNSVLDAIKKNRKEHEIAYNSAMENYRKVIKIELENMIKSIDENKEISHEIRIRKPEQYLSSYDQAIKMLEMTTDTEMELDGEMFSKLIMNNWEWSNSFCANTTIYANGNVGLGSANPELLLDVFRY